MKSEMIKYLFLYGTLLQPEPDKELALVVNRFHRIGAGSVRGRLYDFGDYPGAVIDPSSNTSVHGELVELPEDESVFALDEYEEFNPTNPQHSLFVRTEVRIQLTDGQNVDAWMYVYNKHPGDAPLITGGIYSKSQVA
jgi:gamma-glutamylcyclotransferase (GGCT)/AIG2-like uncharacterized protein YtfP